MCISVFTCRGLCRQAMQHLAAAEAATQRSTGTYFACMLCAGTFVGQHSRITSCIAAACANTLLTIGARRFGMPSARVPHCTHARHALHCIECAHWKHTFAAANDLMTSSGLGCSSSCCCSAAASVPLAVVPSAAAAASTGCVCARFVAVKWFTGFAIGATKQVLLA